MRSSWGGGLTVSSTDRWFSELRAGRAFAKAHYNAPGAGNFGPVQLWLPAATGVQAIVAQIRVWGSGANRLNVYTHNAALTTDRGALPNLLRAGAAAASHIYSDDIAAVPGTLIESLYIAANTLTVIYPSWGPELSPGQGIHLANNVANADLIVEFLVNEV